MKFKVIYKTRSTFPGFWRDTTSYSDYGNETIEANSIVDANKKAKEHANELGENIVVASVKEI